MIISHEVPIPMLPMSRYFNDYDYALVHLFEEYPEYFDFYKESVEMGRHVLLDNSIFELGVAFSGDQYAKWVEKLNPTEYIVPDVLDNAQATLASAMSWFSTYNLKQKTILVTQGESLDQMVWCAGKLTTMSERLAVPFNATAYERALPELPPLFAWMHGRRILIDRLIDEEIITNGESVHLLGCSVPQEFQHYKGSRYSMIHSVDTSNPVVKAIEGSEYSDFGTDNKSPVKLIDYIKHDYQDFNLLRSNVEAFKRWVA